MSTVMVMYAAAPITALETAIAFNAFGLTYVGTLYSVISPITPVLNLSDTNSRIVLIAACIGGYLTMLTVHLVSRKFKKE